MQTRGSWILLCGLVIACTSMASAAAPPRVVRTTPEALANDVPASLREIKVTFDQRMANGSYSWTGGGDTLPKTLGKPFYDRARRTCTLRVRLTPGHVYWVGVNSPSFRGFRSARGEPAARYVVLFATRSAAGKPTPIPEKMLSQAKAINGPAAEDGSTGALCAGGDQRKRYFLFGPKADAKAPETGYRLLVVLPGGDGGLGFRSFVERIQQRALPPGYLVAQLVAVQWSPQQAQRLVWPTAGDPWAGMKFSTEQFVKAVVDAVAAKHKLDRRHVYTLGWSSGGPACYAVSLDPKCAVRGTFVAMSVFKPGQLPSLAGAKGHRYYLLHSPQDFIPMRMAQQARDALRKAGADTKLVTYPGGHGWRGDVFGMIRKGVAWLERPAGRGEPK